MLNQTQKSKVIEIWDYYIKNRMKFINASEEYTQEELDQEREKVIFEAKKLISGYTTGKLSFEEFKTEIDSLNKRNRLWGFKGMNGQMYFNMLTNSSTGAGLLDNFKSILKETVVIPNDISEAKRKIESLVKFSDSLANYVSDKRQAPRTGSCNFFITYFWQIQDHHKWPIYYKSMLDALLDTGLWSPSGDLPKDYEEFYQLNYEMKAIISEKTKKECTLWDVEHALWVWGIRNEVTDETTSEEIIEAQYPASELPTSFIPPVVSILPLLAKNDPQMIEACQKTGISVEKAFEEKISVLFKMLGYKVESMGQGYGRVPDGVAVCSEFHYALIYDAKVRTNGYTVGTDDRAIKEYIFYETDRLKRQGIRNIYFLIISSTFNGDFDDVIRSIKMDTEVRELIFVEAAALLTLLEQKLRNCDLDLGPNGIQSFFAQSGIISNTEMKRLLSLGI